jgi:hypothetical protein
MQVYRLGKELDRKVYRFGNGRELLGREMLLELEELNGPRELRYRFVAKDEPNDPEASKKGETVSKAAGRADVEATPRDAMTGSGV